MPNRSSMKQYFLFFFLFLYSCSLIEEKDQIIPFADDFTHVKYVAKDSDLVLSRSEYYEKLYGFWLGQCIANWTGLSTEMDKIGNVGDSNSGDFYTRNDWGGLSTRTEKRIDFVLKSPDEIWGSDDDTDIEYMYQYLMSQDHNILSAEQIRNGWLKHIKKDEENFLWVSNQRAFDLMKDEVFPPDTGSKELNEFYEMIDAQLTTEIFGLFAPGREDYARKLSHLPIRTTARENAAWISEFYVTMHSLASTVDQSQSMKDQIMWLAEKSRFVLPEDSYASKMYDYVKGKYHSNIPWEQARDSVYYRYQVNEKDGYDMTSKNLGCNACFAAGINFAASLVSLFYGEGDYKETIKIGTLCGWDSDNPTSTWGGLIGFLLGKEKIEQIFNRKFSNTYNIHRTRQNFPNDGIDTFENMSIQGVHIIDKIVQSQLNGGIDKTGNKWYIPIEKSNKLSN